MARQLNCSDDMDQGSKQEATGYSHLHPLRLTAWCEQFAVLPPKPSKVEEN